MMLMAVFIETHAAVVAESGAEVIFLAAGWTVIGNLARGHRQENTVVSVDEFHIADDKSVIEGQRAKRLETACALSTQINANFRQNHDVPPVQTITAKRETSFTIKRSVPVGPRDVIRECDRRTHANTTARFKPSPP